jgi:nitrogen fixation protein FixH
MDIMPKHKTSRDRPKELTGRMVLMCLVAFFAIVAGVNAVMITAAISTFGGVETANAYQAGLAYATEEAAARAQEARHWRVNAQLRREPNGATAVELSAHNKDDRPLSAIEARVLLLHPADRRFDHTIEMQKAGMSRFYGTTTPAQGQWDLVVELLRDGERLFRSKERVILR